MKYVLMMMMLFFLITSGSFRENFDSTVIKTIIKAEEAVEVENWQVYEIGIASWYGPGFHGRKTANGEKYDMYAMTAAHKKLKFGTKVRVTDLSSNKSIIVIINDRGPFIKGRVIDLSKTAMNELVGNKGLTKVKLEIIK